MPNQYPEIYIQILTSFLIGALLLGFIGVILVLYQKKKLLQQKELANMQTAFEKELLQTRLEIQEEVLKNISMEIHDNIGQVMLLANVNTSILQAMPMPLGAPELIGETKVLLGKAIEDISQLARSLHSDRITEMGVFNAIIYELQLLEEKGIYSINISNMLTDEESKLSKETQLVIFRIYQEISKNIIKHASATQIDLIIRKIDKGIQMILSDNGVGFNMESTIYQKSPSNGIGMRSLQTRIKLIGGSLSFESALQEGTRITIFIPELIEDSIS